RRSTRRRTTRSSLGGAAAPSAATPTPAVDGAPPPNDAATLPGSPMSLALPETHNIKPMDANVNHPTQTITNNVVRPHVDNPEQKVTTDGERPPADQDCTALNGLTTGPTDT